MKPNGQGRMNYTYMSPYPFNFRDHDNPWVALCPDLTISDPSSTQLTAAYVHFDQASSRRADTSPMNRGDAAAFDVRIFAATPRPSTCGYSVETSMRRRRGSDASRPARAPGTTTTTGCGTPTRRRTAMGIRW